MKRNQKRIFPLIMVLQIFIISFVVMAIPASATPGLPTALKGSVNLDGKLAPVGTEISVELNGLELDNTIMTTKGENDGLFVSISSKNYTNLKFYVNGNEAKLVDAIVIENVDAEAAVLEGVDITATSPVNSNNDNGGGGGGSRIPTTSDSGTDDGSTAITSTTDADDTSLKSVATTQPTESSEDVPSETDTGLSMITILIGAIILIGIIGTVGYKLKEN